MTGAEITVFFTATVKAFTARARIDRERDNDIRAAIAGYETGEVIPALATLVDDVVAIRRVDESVSDALHRAGDVGGRLATAVIASIRSQSPRAKEKVLIQRYTALGVCVLAAQVAAPIALYNIVTGGYNIPRTAVIVTMVVLTLGILGSIVLAVLVARGETALARAIREGKDAG